MKKTVCNNGEFTYALTTCVKSSQEHEDVAVYSFSITYEGKTTSAEAVTNDHEAVKKLFDLIVEEQLYPEHLNDVIEDFIICGNT